MAGADSVINTFKPFKKFETFKPFGLVVGVLSVLSEKNWSVLVGRIYRMKSRDVSVSTTQTGPC
jgi:hypothetical protein